MATAKLVFKKVLTVPTTPCEPNTFFLVQVAAGKFDSYVSSSDGTALFATPTHADVVAAASAAQTAAIASAKTYTDTTVASAVTVATTSLATAVGGKLIVVPTYADLTTYVAAHAGVSFLALVTDAKGDPSGTVGSGSATYVVNGADESVTKIAEHESMDAVITWANIVGRPNSSAADIDLAVSKMHTHANITVLDALGDDGNGALTYKGTVVAPSNLVANLW